MARSGYSAKLNSTVILTIPGLPRSHGRPWQKKWKRNRRADSLGPSSLPLPLCLVLFFLITLPSPTRDCGLAHWTGEVRRVRAWK